MITDKHLIARLLCDKLLIVFWYFIDIDFVLKYAFIIITHYVKNINCISSSQQMLSFSMLHGPGGTGCDSGHFPKIGVELSVVLVGLTCMIVSKNVWVL